MNSASVVHPLLRGFGGVEPTSLTQPFPSHLGLSVEHRQRSCVRRGGVPVLSMNWGDRIRTPGKVWELLCTGLFTAGAIGLQAWKAGKTNGGGLVRNRARGRRGRGIRRARGAVNKFIWQNALKTAKTRVESVGNQG